jgi:hypothetical protein
MLVKGDGAPASETENSLNCRIFLKSRRLEAVKPA